MNNTVKEVLKMIEDNGFEAYLVGGYPRDFLLGIETNDYDICTSAKKEDLENIFGFQLDDNYGSISLEYKGIKFEITTYRKDINYEGVRTPNIVYTDKLEVDTLRRDFTINTICMNYKEEIIDILDGQKDINNKIIKCVGNVDKKISEDPLRILRAIRFASILKFNIEESLEQAILTYGYKIKDLSYFRKKQELDKIFNNGGISLLKKYNLTRYLEIDFNDIVEVTSNLGIWAQIKYSNNYEFSNYEKNKISVIKRIINKKNINNYDLYSYDIDTLKIAADILSIKDLEKKYESLPIKNRNDIDITYDEIKENSDILPSIIYTNLEQAILNKRVENNKKSIVDYVKNLNVYDIDK